MPRSRSSLRPAVSARLVLLLSLSAAGCAPALFGRRPSATRDWRATSDSARVASDSGRFDAADRWLAQFLARHPSAPQAPGARIWRVLLQLEPGNQQGGARRAMALVDSLGGSADPVTMEQLQLLRHVARLQDELSQRVDAQAREIAQAREALADVAERQATPQRPERPPEPRALAEEVRRLREALSTSREELAKANAELERVRRRLAAPRP